MRYWEIDAVRGIAVSLMITYHFVFDILYFETYNNLYLYAAIIASIFILVSGISLSISYARGGRFLKFSKRGLKLSLLGMIVTAASFLLLKGGFIIFGILHFFGLSSFLIYPFLKYLKNNLSYLFFGVLTIFIGIFLSGLTFETNYFLWLGLIPRNFYTFDYFPIIPWFGILLLGIFLGKTFYPKGKRIFRLPAFKGKIVNVLSFLGKNSLIIYFIHQPIILFILFLMGHGQFLSAFGL